MVPALQEPLGAWTKDAAKFWGKGHQTQAWGSRKVSHCRMTQRGLGTSRKELVSERAPPHVQTERPLFVSLLGGFSVTTGSQTWHPF